MRWRRPSVTNPHGSIKSEISTLTDSRIIFFAESLRIFAVEQDDVSDRPTCCHQHSALPCLAFSNPPQIDWLSYAWSLVSPGTAETLFGNLGQAEARHELNEGAHAACQAIQEVGEPHLLQRSGRLDPRVAHPLGRMLSRMLLRRARCRRRLHGTTLPRAPLPTVRRCCPSAHWSLCVRPRHPVVAKH